MPSIRDQPERQHREPEIIPPGDDWPNRDSRWPPNYGFNEGRGTHRVYVSRIGPLGFVLLLLMLALFGGVFMPALIGAAVNCLLVLHVIVGVVADVDLIGRL